MSINFPLILVLATGLTGVIWVFDVYFLRPKRVSAAEGVKQKFKDDAKKAEDAIANILREPIVVEYSISFFPVLLIVLVLRSFLAEPFQIPTGSMIPTLKIGDFIVVNKFAYGVRLPVIGTKIISVDDPKNGEVMVFIPPHQDEYFIKRVVGVPGDRVRYEDKKLYINGVQQSQQFVAKIPPNNPSYLVYSEILGETEHLIHVDGYRDQHRVEEWVIQEGKYFMMGDNRDDSSDSRSWGMVSEENIVGKAFAIWLHKEPGFNFPDFSHNGWIE
jgi:signal peptidase I